MLRLEDTDRERSTDEAIDQILDALEWLEPRLGRGSVPPDRARRALRGAPRRAARLGRRLLGRRDRRGRQAAQGGARAAPATAASRCRRERPGAAVRLRVPDEGETVVEDVIRGASAFENRLLDDFVIARADRTPLYNFAVAVDDPEMGITHVVRGEDHLSNTPRQLLVLEALGRRAAALRAPAAAARHRRQAALEAPRRGLGPGAPRRRLPARGGAQLPRAARLGLRRDDHLLHDRGADREVLARARLALAGRLRRAEAALDERPLHPGAGAGGARRGGSRVAGASRGLPGADDPRLEQAVAAVQEKISTLAEIPDLVGFAFGPVEIDERAWEKVMAKDGARGHAARGRATALSQASSRSTRSTSRRRCGRRRRARARSRARCSSRCGSPITGQDGLGRRSSRASPCSARRSRSRRIDAALARLSRRRLAACPGPRRRGGSTSRRSCRYVQMSMSSKHRKEASDAQERRPWGRSSDGRFASATHRPGSHAAQRGPRAPADRGLRGARGVPRARRVAQASAAPREPGAALGRRDGRRDRVRRGARDLGDAPREQARRGRGKDPQRARRRSRC